MRADHCRLGDSGEGIGSIGPALKLQHVKFVCPTAPVRPVTVNMGMSINAWFDIASLGEAATCTVAQACIRIVIV